MKSIRLSLLLVLFLCFALLPSFVMGEPEIPDPEYSDLVYDPVNSRYLHVYEDTGDIYGQFYETTGAYAGSPFVISDNDSTQGAPEVAYAFTHQMFLVVWEDARPGSGTDIYGQFVTAAGNLHETASAVNFPICTADTQQQKADVAYDPVTDRFLAAWGDRRSNGTNSDIYGQFISLSESGYLFSTTSTQNFQIAAGNYGQHGPAVGYDETNDLFLVAFMDYRDPDNNIYGQFVDAANLSDFLYSTAAGTNFPIGTTEIRKTHPALAYDSDNGRFLVVWDQIVDKLEWDIAGQIVDASDTTDFLFGTNHDVNIMISDNAEIWQNGPRAAYHPATGNYLVAWTDYRGDGSDVYGQALGAGGVLLETTSVDNYPLKTSSSADYTGPVGASIPGSDRVIVVYKVDDTYWEATVYDPTPEGGGGGGGCNTSPAPGDPVWPEVILLALIFGVVACRRYRSKTPE